MTWKKLVANKNVVGEPPSKAELDNLRSIVARSMKDVDAPGLSADARFVMAYDAARTLSLMIVSGMRTTARLRFSPRGNAAVRRAWRAEQTLAVARQSAALTRRRLPASTRRCGPVKWIGRRSNPRLLVFSQVPGTAAQRWSHLSYRSKIPTKKPGVFVTPGFEEPCFAAASRQAGQQQCGRASQAQRERSPPLETLRGERIRRLTGQ